ncbi:MAG: PLP-dependent transferase [Clostridia bacterium]|nr:PLP-dependent transferase [Clostridia bacterium]
MKPGTRVLHTGVEIDKYTGAASIPIYQVSTFNKTDVHSLDEGYIYSRTNNPTREALEEAACRLEYGNKGFAFASGMAAISSVFSIFGSGDHIVACSDIYGGAHEVLTELFPRFGMEVSFVDATDLDAVKKAIRKNTKALYLETPSNPLMRITDLRGACEIARQADLISIVDNTFMTPYLQNPLRLGADIVIHSATKFLGGHSDVTAGIVIVDDDELAGKIAAIQKSFGAVIGPMDAWLVMRGIKTLKVRMEQHEHNAMEIANWIGKQPGIAKVYYPGLKDHPGHHLHKEQSSGFGAVLSFQTNTIGFAKKIMHGIKLPVLGVSLGGVESIMSYPVLMSHASIPQDQKEALGISEDLIRFSVGIEDVEDLIADLEQAMK